jgi:hypothetical protein
VSADVAVRRYQPPTSSVRERPELGPALALGDHPGVALAQDGAPGRHFAPVGGDKATAWLSGNPEPRQGRGSCGALSPVLTASQPTSTTQLAPVPSYERIPPVSVSGSCRPERDTPLAGREDGRTYWPAGPVRRPKPAVLKPAPCMSMRPELTGASAQVRARAPAAIGDDLTACCLSWGYMWWQVLGSNQRRLSRRFYRPLPLATRATCLAPPEATAQ